MWINAVLRRKEAEFDTEKCKIEKIIILPQKEYQDFRKDMLKDRKFIKENRELMYIGKDEIVHTILILGEGEKDGILVEAEGSPYARYSSFVPNMSEYIDLKSKEIIDMIVEEGSQKTESGNYIFSIKEIDEKYGLDINCMKETIKKMIEAREEVSDVQMSEDEIDVNYYLDYCSKLKENNEENISSNNKINVLIVEPSKHPRRAVIENNYKELNRIVGGLIEVVAVAPGVDLICNDEGKIIGLPGNRRVGNDIIAGTFILVGTDGGEEFISLSNSQIEEYESRFWEPEEYITEEVDETIGMDFIGF